MAVALVVSANLGGGKVRGVYSISQKLIKEKKTTDG